MTNFWDFLQTAFDQLDFGCKRKYNKYKYDHEDILASATSSHDKKGSEPTQVGLTR